MNDPKVHGGRESQVPTDARMPRFANAQSFKDWLASVSDEDLAALYEVEPEVIGHQDYAAEIFEKALAEVQSDLRRSSSS
jgi:hypothetical protein